MGKSAKTLERQVKAMSGDGSTKTPHSDCENQLHLIVPFRKECREESVVVEFSQSPRGSEHPLNAFEVIQPVLDHIEC